MLNDKGLAKNNWVNVIGSTVASTNHIFIEDIVHVVIKIIKNINFNLKSGIMSIKNNKNSEGKLACVKGVG